MKRPKKLMARIQVALDRAEDARASGDGDEVRRALFDAKNDTDKLLSELKRRVGGR